MRDRLAPRDDRAPAITSLVAMTIPTPRPRVAAPRLGVPEAEALGRVLAFADDLERRRSVRDFDDRPFPDGVLEEAVRVAATAPSGAHVQPWRFMVVTDPEVRARLRGA